MRNEEDTVPKVNRIEICQLMALNDFFARTQGFLDLFSLPVQVGTCWEAMTSRFFLLRSKDIE